MAYDNIISRTDVGGLLPESTITSLLSGVTQQSAAMQLFRRVPVGAGVTNLPVLSALPVAYWVSGDTGVKQTTEANWTKKTIAIEELAAIIPVPQNVVDDLNFDIWTELEPLMASAIAVALDQAIFFGTNAPAAFPSNVNTAAAAAGNAVTAGSTAATGGYPNDISLVMNTVEADGFTVSDLVAHASVRGALRGARDSTGQLLSEVSPASAWGVDIFYGISGGWPAAATGAPRLFAIDGSQFVLGVRKDITFDIATEGVITDAAGLVVYNLFQQDMAAMRVTFRAGWQVANTITADQAVEASRYPAGVLRLA